MTHRTTIDDRLQNWARWAKAEPRQIGVSPTGAFCDRLRRAAGVVEDHSNERRYIDELDAQLLEHAMRNLIRPKRETLRLHYVDQTRWQIVCRRAHVRIDKPHFEMVLRQAQEAVESVVQRNMEHR